MPSYRTKAEPGADAKGKPLYGLKMTTAADKAFNGGDVGKDDAKRKLSEIRAGSVSKGEGVYKINGIQCYHNKVGSKKVAVAWHFDSTTKPNYVIVEAFIEHTGKDNDYRLL